MSIQLAEELKSKLTDQYVTVVSGVAELRRFEGRTGVVKTVNMNGQALVEFDGPADIGWYDISPSFLNVVQAPVAKGKAEPKAKSESKPAAAPKAKSAAPTGG
ncbi:MAG: hypothetical protein O3A00_24800, partial [Planctomycetota bacterium]|nr:hypothetical protein [Planctomycetota bacterium]